ncbi:MAG: DUF128 domain-containing protein [Methanothrix sp.]|jgi:Uncharacterized protein conserved in archaea|nr:DUF128 domain-containing protein [Methanothrix sp.]NPU86636.1 DUF128 domain-containing protein [Methanothrix sp.]
MMQEPLVFALGRIENLVHQVSLDAKKGTGRVITNRSLVARDDLHEALEIFKDAIDSGLAVSPLVRLEDVGERFMIHTVCSMTIDGYLIKHGIPVRPKGGGLIEVIDRETVRFTDIIMYWATTIDPLDLLIAQELTGICEMMRTGTGRILGNLHEAPMIAHDTIEDLLDELRDAGIMGVIELGDPNMDVLGMPVERDHLGVALIGGTNPAAAAVEFGLDIETASISGLTEISEMCHIDELIDRML